MLAHRDRLRELAIDRGSGIPRLALDGPLVVQPLDRSYRVMLRFGRAACALVGASVVTITDDLPVAAEDAESL